MSHTLRPRATCISKALRNTHRTIFSTSPRQYPEAEVKEEEQLDQEDVPTNFLSSRSEIDSFLRAQNDLYLSKMEKNLRSLSQTAEAINTLLPTLSRRSALIRPPSNSSTQIEKASIPPYTVPAWRKASELVPPITQALCDQIQRLSQNIEDLQGEPYRADVTPSEREKVEGQVKGWSTREKEKGLLNAELVKSGMEARFLRGVQRLDEGIKEMVGRREEREKMEGWERERLREGGSGGGGGGDRTAGSSTTTSTTSLNADGSGYSYRPFSSTTPATGMEIPNTEGWGASATKVEERGRHHARTSNPFKKTTTSTSGSSSAKGDLGALKSRLKSNNDDSRTRGPREKVLSFKAEAAGPEAESKTEEAQAGSQDAKAEAEPPKAEPKFKSLAEMQRRMNELQGDK